MAATTMATDRPCGADLANAGGGLGLGIIQVSAIIPGFLPALILTVALVAVVVVPLMALGLLAALLAAPPYGLSRLAARRRQRRREP
jgi:ABC-type sugar transport system permease subunit